MAARVQATAGSGRGPKALKGAVSRRTGEFRHAGSIPAPAACRCAFPRWRQPLGWAEKELLRRRKGDKGKVSLARQLRGNHHDFALACGGPANGQLDIRLKPVAGKTINVILFQ